MSYECSCSTHVVIVSAALFALLLLCKQMLMMGFPHCTDKQAVRPSLSPLRRFTWRRVFFHFFTSFQSHDTHPFFFLSSSLFFSPLFLNSSLFSAHVYFYPTVHGRSQRNDEAWETCSSPWQLYSKPSFPNAAFITTLHTLATLILLSHLFGPVFFRFSPPSAPHPPPTPGLSCLSPLWTNGAFVDAVRFIATVRPTFVWLENLCGFSAVQGGFPISPLLPPTTPFLLGSAKKKRSKFSRILPI